LQTNEHPATPLEIEIVTHEQVRTYDLSVSAVLGEGKRASFIPYAIDITERKEAQEQMEVLYAELRHRIKNLFSMVNALINLSARHADSVEDFAQSTVSRLSALHHAHNLGSADLRKRGASLSSVLETVLEPWRTQSQRISITGDDLFLDSGQATSWALIIHELITNATKHGALVADGKVDISFKGDAPSWRFEWRESGAEAMIDEKTRLEGFGITIVKRLAAAYLDADVNFQFGPKGLTAVLTHEETP